MLIVDANGYVYDYDEPMGMVTFLGLSRLDCFKPAGNVGDREAYTELKDPQPYNGVVLSSPPYIKQNNLFGTRHKIIDATSEAGTEDGDWYNVVLDGNTYTLNFCTLDGHARIIVYPVIDGQVQTDKFQTFTAT